LLLLTVGDNRWKAKNVVEKNRRTKSQRTMNHGTSSVCRMGNRIVSDGELKNEKNRKERIKIHQELGVNIVDWLLAIDFDAGWTSGQPKR
jgi:hypothetical protein